MGDAVYWCSNCKVPIIKHNRCTLCGGSGKLLSSVGVCNPVFEQERKLLSKIFEEDLSNSDLWYLGSSFYLIDGKRKKLPYIDFYKEKRHLAIAADLRREIVCDDSFPGKDRFIAANLQYLKEIMFEAERYITNLISDLKERSQNNYVPTVSFSGGKDSTVVSRIVRDALQTESVIHYFGDTTLEFPCTYSYVEKDFRTENPFTPMIPSETSNDFFKLCDVFGPPSRYERWCCTIFKTSNLNTEYQNLTGNSLTFLGIRHSESKERQGYERTQTHSKIGSQINAMPIIEWSDCDVWLYILYKNLKFNNAYRWGYKRVGCWCCPNNSEWSAMLTEIYFPELATKWRATLTNFAIKTNKDDIEDYIENKRWKSRRGASGLQTRNVSIADTACNLSDRARNIIIKKKLNRDVIEFFKPFGHLDILDKADASYISITEAELHDQNGELLFPKRKLCELIITWGTPVVKVLPAKTTDIILLVNRLKCQLRKYQYCIRCSACDSICPYGAISTIGDGRYTVDENKCRQNLSECSRCIAKFYNGCITCQVLSGKKETAIDNIDP